MTQISQIPAVVRRGGLHLRGLRHLWILSLIILGGCTTQPPLERFEFNRLAMGVQARIVLYAVHREAASGGAAAAFDEIARLEQIMSDYRADSELMQLGANAGGRPVPVSDDLFDILSIASDISKASGGAFDVTIGPLSRVWRDARQRNEQPDPSKIDAALAHIGWQNVALNAGVRTAQLGRNGMSLDLGGIAKGYAADHAVRKLRKMGLHRCLVALAGDIALGDPPPERDGWRIELATQLMSGSISRTLLLANACVSTSGDSEQFIEVDGVRYSHIIDPRTGMGITNHSLVTVVAPSGALADGLSSAISVLAPFGFELAWEFERVAVIIEVGNERSAADPWRLLKWEPVRASTHRER